MTDYDVFGLQAGLAYKRLQLSLFVKNLTDTTFPALQFQQVTAGVGTVYAVRYDKPRTIGGSISFRW
jgi:outer membrane receptor protein involved in Fe transport